MAERVLWRGAEEGASKKLGWDGGESGAGELGGEEEVIWDGLEFVFSKIADVMCVARAVVRSDVGEMGADARLCWWAVLGQGDKQLRSLVVPSLWDPQEFHLELTTPTSWPIVVVSLTVQNCYRADALFVDPWLPSLSVCDSLINNIGVYYL